MLHPTDYAKNYAGIMGAGLIIVSGLLEKMSIIFYRNPLLILIFYFFPDQ